MPALRTNRIILSDRADMPRRSPRPFHDALKEFRVLHVVLELLPVALGEIKHHISGRCLQGCVGAGPFVFFFDVLLIPCFPAGSGLLRLPQSFPLERYVGGLMPPWTRAFFGLCRPLWRR